MTAVTAATVGFVGIGNMGWPMATHLVRGGVRLVVHDRDAARAASFVREVGGRRVDDPAALAAAAELIITMLPDGAALREVVLGGADRPPLVDGIAGGAVLVDMGSSDPRAYPAIREALEGRGASMVDAPVSGAVTGARAGTLTIMAGGEAAAIDRVEPLLQLMGERVFRTGALGTGQAMKALNNLASAGNFLLALEVLAIGQRRGLDPAQMTRILNVSTGRSNATDKKILPHVLSRRFDSGFALALMVKDLATARGLAETSATPTVIAPTVIEAARAALDALGDGADHTEIARWLERQLGEELRSRSDPAETALGDTS